MSKNSVLVIAFLGLFTAASSAQSNMSLVWQRTLGGTGYDEATSIVSTRDGGMIVAGYSASSDGDVNGHHGSADVPDGWIVKMDANRNVQWQRSLGGSFEDQIVRVIQTTDGGYAVAGYSGSDDGDFTANAGVYDGFVAKLDSLGNITWIHNFGGQTDDEFYSLAETSDHGLIVCGTSNSTNGDLRTQTHFGGYDAWVVKLSSAGSIDWQRTYGGTDDEEAYDIKTTSDGGFIFSGYTYSATGTFAANHGSTDMWVVKLGSTGAPQWQKLIGGTLDEEGDAVIQTSDKGYAIIGYTTSFDGDVTDNHSNDTLPDCFLVKLDQNGTKLWTKCYGGSDDDAATDVIETTPDHGLAFAGYASSLDGDLTKTLGPPDAWLVKTDAAGTLQWQVSLGGGDSDVAYSLAQRVQSVLFCGSTASTNGDVTSNHGFLDVWVGEYGVTSGVPSQTVRSTRVMAYPNPFSIRTSIVLPDGFLDGSSGTSVTLVNSIGTEVLHRSVTGGGNTIVLERGTLATGLYQCRVVSGAKVHLTTLVVVN